MRTSFLLATRRDTFIYSKGDFTDTPCQLLGEPAVIKRKNRYIPLNRTAAYVLTGSCKFDG
jgi:hypothetical protein